MKIQIEMTGNDFNHLCEGSTFWAKDKDWPAQVRDGRFEHVQRDYDTPPQMRWQWAHWFGNSWANVILARSFLEGQNQEYEILYDLADNYRNGYVILTDYESINA